MLHLSHSSLRVDVLDPANPAERRHLGTRYCWGGYIWNVHAPGAGPLLTGPEWPESSPSPFNGQGLPESFRHAPLNSREFLTIEQGRGFIVGVGDVTLDATGAPVISTPCEWNLRATAGALEFTTRQAGLGWAVGLRRTLRLEQNELTSATEVTCAGERPLPLQWFAHPFFPWTDDPKGCVLPAGTRMEENPGYEVDATGRLRFKRRFVGTHDGHFQLVELPAGTRLHATFPVPHFGAMSFETDFAPDLCPMWGNGNTWSIEPYILTHLAPGQTRRWTLRYGFEAK